MENKVININVSAKGYTAISKVTSEPVTAIIHKWRRLATVVNLPRSGQLSKITN